MVVMGAILFLLTLCLLFLCRQPTTQQKLSFKVPLVPFLPTASIFVNIYLMAKLSAATWVRFSVWLTIGALIYGLYGWRNASEEYRYRGMIPPNQRKG